MAVVSLMAPDLPISNYLLNPQNAILHFQLMLKYHNSFLNSSP